MERTKKPNEKQFNILTNDPSMRAWGWAVMTVNGRVVKTGCIKTEPETKKRRIRKSDDTTRRASEINQTLLQVVKQYNIRYLLSELPHGSQNASGALMIGVVVGLMQMLSDATGIAIEWFSENDSKKCVLHKNSATKQEMISAISELYGVPWTGVQYKDEAVADAIAVFHTATKNSSTLKMLKMEL